MTATLFAAHLFAYIAQLNFGLHCCHAVGHVNTAQPEDSRSGQHETQLPAADASNSALQKLRNSR